LQITSESTKSNFFFKNSDIIIAMAVVAVVVMMIVPLPSQLLDVLLTLNITFALIILLLGMFTSEPLQFSVFPSLLLITTLFRLALNISGTRLILLDGYAGEVIQAFGQFTVRGNYVVGAIIFLILILIQFIVITHGATRVSEVAARFTLDAMPGKQMAIDADLNSGLINEAEARQRRKDIEDEADFYGAMDGASKFIKGDAVASIVIIIINILGGFIIGVLQKGMPLMQAASTYTILTIGEGLVTQIPALLISTATGIVVTRAASDANLGADVGKQLLQQPRAFMIVAGLLGGFFLIPGLPKLPFLLMAIACFFLYRTLKQVVAPELAAEGVGALPGEAGAAGAAPGEPGAPSGEPENMVPLLYLDPMEMEIGYGLIPLVDVEQGGDLLERITMIRRQNALEAGLLVPPIRVRDNMQLAPNAYVFKIYGLEVARGEVMVGRYMAMNPGTAEEEMDGIETREPAFGLPALWIPQSMKDRAETSGYTVIDCSSVIATHLMEVIKTYAADLLGRQEVQILIDNLRATHPVVIDELIPGIMTVGEVQKILQNLLKERLSIRNLLLVSEKLADEARNSKDPVYLTEKVRQALARSICQDYRLPDGTMPVITLEPVVESQIAETVQHPDKDTYAALDPDTIRRIYASLLREVEKVTTMGFQPIVLCSQTVRLYFKRLTERVLPNLVVLSYNEILAEVMVEAVGQIRLSSDTESFT